MKGPCSSSGRFSPLALPGLHGALGRISDGVMVVDRGWRCVYANAAAERSMGVGRGKAVGRVVWEVFPGLGKTAVGRGMRKAMGGKGTFRGCYEARGTWFEVRAFAVGDSLTLVWRDLSAQRRAEEALAASESQYKQAFEDSPLAECVTDPRTRRIVRVNTRACQLLGYTSKELVGLRIEDITDREDVAQTVRFFRRIVSGRDPEATLTKRYRRKDGSVVHTRVHVAPVYGPDGRIQALNGIIEDITEGMRAQEALRASQARLALAQRVGGIGTFDVDLRTGRVVWTPEYERIYGLPPGTFPGYQEDWVSYIHPEDRARVTALVRKSVRRRSSVNAEFRIVRADGQVRWIQDIWRVMCDARGKAVRIVGVNMDITPRKQAEEELRQSQQRFAALSAAAFEGIAVTENARFVDVNEQFARMLGYRPRELIGKPVTVIVAPEYRAQVLWNIRHRVRNVVQHDAVCKDGRRITVEAHARMTVYQGRTARITAVRDITLEKRAEEALRESEGRYRALFENSITGLFESVPQRRFLRVNRAMARMFGYGSPERMKAEVTDIRRQLYADVEQREKLWKILRRDGQAEGYQIAARRRDGSPLWISLNVQLVRAPDGTVLHSQGSVLDITASKLAEEALRASEERFRRIFTEGPLGMVIMEPRTHRILQANASACRIMGYSEGELTARRMEDLTHPEDVEPSVDRLRGVATGREASFQMVKRYIRKDGRMVHARVHGAAIVGGDGEVLHHIGMIEDITAQVEAERKLRQSEQRLRELASELSLAQARERRSLAVEVHDDIGQNLATALIQLELLKRSSSDPAAAEGIATTRELVSSAITRIRALTLGLSPPALYELGLEAALEGLVADFRKVYGLAIEYRAPKWALPRDEVASVLLFRAIRELLVNIVKHAHAGSASLRLARSRREVTVTVADDGAGFDLESLPASRGFGLFSIRTQIEALGGAFAIESGRGRGTRVRLALPAQPGRGSCPGVSP